MARKHKPLKPSDVGTRERHRRVLIYCEGRNTEKIYLLGVKRQLRAMPITVVIGPRHGEPLSLVQAAAKYARAVSADPDERFDQVWCVMDVEAPREHGSLSEALHEAKRCDIKCVLSNPCFELWLILHFCACTGFLTTKQAQAKLATLLPGYDPDDGKSFRYDDLKERMGIATQRAAALHASHTPTDERCQNPCTGVAELLGALGL